MAEILGYNIIILSKGKSFRKEVRKMTSYDLIWLLIEQLLNEKEMKSKEQMQKED